jgi:hypothetical protein
MFHIMARAKCNIIFKHPVALIYFLDVYFSITNAALKYFQWLHGYLSTLSTITVSPHDF